MPKQNPTFKTPRPLKQSYLTLKNKILQNRTNLAKLKLFKKHLLRVKRSTLQCNMYYYKSLNYMLNSFITQHFSNH